VAEASTADAARYVRDCEAIGANGFMVMPSMLYKGAPEETLTHFRSVANATGAPLMIYNNPISYANDVTPAMFAQLAEIPHIVAIKESSGDWNNFYGTYLAVHDRLRVFCGPSSVFGVPAVQLGADGTIDCFPNVWRRGGLDLYFAAKNGDSAHAAELQAMGRKLTDLFTSGGRTLYPATKAAMDMLGYPGGGTPRPPLRRLSADAADGLKAGLQALHLL
jgi:4-hydroxy-tetrahydrodipicolinate synthase